MGLRNMRHLTMLVLGCMLLNNPTSPKPLDLEKIVKINQENLVVFEERIPGQLEKYIDPKSDKLVYLIPDTYDLVGLGYFRYKTALKNVMQYIVDKKDVRMIGVEGFEGEWKGREELKRFLDDVVNGKEQPENILTRILPPLFLEIKDPEKFYSFGVDDFDLIEESERLEFQMTMAKELEDIRKLNRERVKNMRLRGHIPANNLVDEMEKTGHKLAILPFRNDYIPYIKTQLIDRGVSWIYTDPLDFMEEVYGKQWMEEIE